MASYELCARHTPWYPWPRGGGGRRQRKSCASDRPKLHGDPEGGAARALRMLPTLGTDVGEPSDAQGPLLW